MKKAKKWIWIAAAVVILAGGITAAVLLTRNNKEPVYVYGFSEGIAGMTDYYDGGNESSGMVTTDRIQPVYLSSTQTVLEVLVTEGQEVKKGEVLFTYDTTLSDITLRQKDLSVQQAKLDLETAKKELAVINSYVPISYHEVVVPEETEPAEPVGDLAEFDLTGKDYLAYSGSGSTSLTPKYCWLRSSAMVDENMMAALFAETTENVLFVRFRHTENDAADGAVTGEYGIKMMRLSTADEDGSQSYTYRYSFFDPNAAVSNAPVDDGIDWNSGYTAAEIASMRTAKQAEIKEMEFNIKVAEAEYSIMQKEADSGEAVAEFDGIVVGLQDPEMLIAEEPFLKVSGGGGFYVTGSVSELELGNIQVGQKVSVMSWDNYMSYEGTVTEIQPFPQESRYSYYGNQNVSYYPYTVFIDESADLQDGYYVSMTLQAGEDQSGLYINSAFVRTEGASSYVYVRGENGRLEKRTIQVGGSLWGSYTEVLGGLTAEDYVAFPYGKTVKEGAPTQEGTWDNLYGY
ncbi:MAG: biotin/lipoyl-binding protein [Oscillospiraceae bacterium]|nr:biotin/lipoyl-binding protein [Oscillospiraceae bacterium]